MDEELKGRRRIIWVVIAILMAICIGCQEDNRVPQQAQVQTTQKDIGVVKILWHAEGDFKISAGAKSYFYGIELPDGTPCIVMKVYKHSDAGPSLSCDFSRKIAVE